MEQVSELEHEIINLQRYHSSQASRLSEVCRERNNLETALRASRERETGLQQRAQRTEALEAQLQETTERLETCSTGLRKAEDSLCVVRAQLEAARRSQRDQETTHWNHMRELLFVLLMMAVALRAAQR